MVLSGSLLNVVTVPSENKLSCIAARIPLGEIYLAVLWKKSLHIEKIKSSVKHYTALRQHCPIVCEDKDVRWFFSKLATL